MRPTQITEQQITDFITAGLYEDIREGDHTSLATIPADAVRETPRDLAGDRWKFSFSRYDYTRGHGAPVISSTSPHAQPGFHRLHEFGELRFQA